MSSNILVFEALPRPRRIAWLVSAYGGEWEDKYERPLAVYATKGEAIRAAEAYEAEGHDDLYCDGCAEGAYVYEIEGENYDGPIDPTCELVELWDGERGEYRLDCTACHFGERAGELRDEDPDMYNSRNLWSDVDWQLLRHCPYCGARVVKTGDW